MRTEHTGKQEGAHGNAGPERHVVDAHQDALRPGLHVGTDHAVDPHVAVQRRPEVPLCAAAQHRQGCSPSGCCGSWRCCASALGPLQALRPCSAQQHRSAPAPISAVSACTVKSWTRGCPGNSARGRPGRLGHATLLGSRAAHITYVSAVPVLEAPSFPPGHVDAHMHACEVSCLLSPSPQPTQVHCCLEVLSLLLHSRSIGIGRSIPCRRSSVGLRGSL